MKESGGVVLSAVVPWFLLFDGSSADGRGAGSYCGRTTDINIARRHLLTCKKNPYSIGGVKMVTDIAICDLAMSDFQTLPERYGVA